MQNVWLADDLCTTLWQVVWMLASERSCVCHTNDMHMCACVNMPKLTGRDQRYLSDKIQYVTLFKTSFFPTVIQLDILSLCTLMWAPLTILSLFRLGYPHECCKVFLASMIHPQGNWAWSFESLGVAYKFVVHNSTQLNHGSRFILFIDSI